MFSADGIAFFRSWKRNFCLSAGKLVHRLVPLADRVIFWRTPAGSLLRSENKCQVFASTVTAPSDFESPRIVRHRQSVETCNVANTMVDQV